MLSVISIFLAGFLGAIVKEILDDNSLEMPKKVDGKICLGSFGGFLVGGITGYLVDGSPLTAFTAGYAGTGLITSLMAEKKTVGLDPKVFIRALIRAEARKQGVPEDLAVKVAECESSLNPAAINTNKDGSRDRGLYQINEKWHPEVSDQQAFDIVLSTRFFCESYKNNHLDWWNATKSCWSK